MSGTKTLAVVWIVAAGLCFGASDSTIALSNGIRLTIHTTLGTPTGMTSVAIEMDRASGNSFYRIFRDQNHLAVFAYELEVARMGADGFRLTTKPVEDEFATRFPYADGGKPVPSFSSTRDYDLKSGEPAIIAVYNLEGQGLDVVDTVQINLNEAANSSEGRLRFSGLTISLNDAPVKTTPGNTVAGRYVMFYLPGQGGFFFSSDAVPGRQFIKAGYIDGNKMQFTVDNLTYECVAQLPIAPQALRQEVWVYHDAAYKPAGNWTLEDPDSTKAEFFTSAADSLDWWMSTAPDSSK